MAEPTASLSSMVETKGDRVRVRQEIYSDPAIFLREMDRIFYQSWIYVAHESEVADVGDYKTGKIGLQPIVVSRHEDGEIYVLLNRCRHRGTVVCREVSGHSNFFRCRYHNWVYRNNGELVGVAQSEGYPEDFPKDDYGLIQLPRVATYRGLIFASIAEEGIDLDEHLAPVREPLDLLLKRSPEMTFSVATDVYKESVPRNWKTLLNYGSQGGVRTVGLDGGHLNIELDPEDSDRSLTRQLLDDHPDYLEAMRVRYADEGLADIARTRSVYVFPNLMISDQMLRIINPLAVSNTEVHMQSYRPVGLPEATDRDRFRRQEMSNGPFGSSISDDPRAADQAQVALRAEFDSTAEGWLELAMQQGPEGEPTNRIYGHWMQLMDKTPA